MDTRLRCQGYHPLIVGMVDKRVKGKRIVQQALPEGAWVHNIACELSFTAHLQLVHLQQAVATVAKNESEADVFSWPWNAAATYTAKSTYMMLCQGMTCFAAAHCIWNS